MQSTVNVDVFGFGQQEGMCDLCAPRSAWSSKVQSGRLPGPRHTDWRGSDQVLQYNFIAETCSASTTAIASREMDVKVPISACGVGVWAAETAVSGCARWSAVHDYLHVCHYSGRSRSFY